MIHCNLPKLKKLIISCLVLFSIIFFVTHSQKQQSILVEDFLNQFLFEEGGAYTLIGNKPLTDMLIFTGSQEDISLDHIRSDSLEQMVYIDDNSLNRWNAWKKFSKNFRFKNFIFLEKRCPRDPTYLWVVLINLPKTLQVIQSHPKLFDKIFSGDNLNIKELTTQLMDPHCNFTDALFYDHYLSGLLHGYGEENSRIFADRAKNKQSDAVPLSSYEPNKDPITDQSFPLPIYAVAGVDSMKSEYEKQREEIQAIYKNGTLIDVTLKFLKGDHVEDATQ